MALAHRMKSSAGRTFGDNLQYYCTITQNPSQQNCNEVHVVVDLYWETSIKNNEHSRRGVSPALKVKICSNTTPIAKQWDKYISNCKNKTNLCNFICTLPCQIRWEKLPENKKKITIRAQGLEMEEKLWALAQLCDFSDIPGLQSNNEEADTWLLLHEKWALENAAIRIVIQLPDTDV